MSTNVIIKMKLLKRKTSLSFRNVKEDIEFDSRLIQEISKKLVFISISILWRTILFCKDTNKLHDCYNINYVHTFISWNHFRKSSSIAATIVGHLDGNDDLQNMKYNLRVFEFTIN